MLGKPFKLKTPNKVPKWFMLTVMRGSVTIAGAVGWFLLPPFIFLFWLPQFNLYNNWLTNQGTTANDVYFFWAWVPTIVWLIFGIFWAGGVIDMIREVHL